MGKEFLTVFDEWSTSYDETVHGENNEYSEYFYKYDEILTLVADHAFGNILEFGVGTGNLTLKLIERKLQVIGVDPSKAMRDIAKDKIPDIQVLDGDFDSYPDVKDIDCIVSSFAFHHLNNKDKSISASKFFNTLNTSGKILFADVVFENLESYELAVEEAMEKGHYNVHRDLTQEYYSTIPELEEIFASNGFKVEFTKCNRYVWLMEAQKLT
ncbi:SAM-dependent methyltransferase [Bacillaceae bacterium SAS-127]|nr:SAM-dependent methyltransferase [Bacillaceae bacterium SAS-127]